MSKKYGLAALNRLIRIHHSIVRIVLPNFCLTDSACGAYLHQNSLTLVDSACDHFVGCRQRLLFDSLSAEEIRHDIRDLFIVQIPHDEVRVAVDTMVRQNV
jgi:hypothetical protein